MSKFYMLIGISGSGKTHYAQSTNENGVILSSDAIRKELYGSEEIQGDNNKIFGLMNERTREALKAGKDVFYDATNLVRKRRVATLQALPKQIFKVGVVICTPIQDCFARNDSRERQVPHEVIMKQLRSFEVPIYSEGFDHIVVVLSGIEDKDYYMGLCNKMRHDSPWHSRDVGEHIKAMMAAAKKDAPEDDFLYSLCAYHDLGKAITKTVDNNGVGHYYGHEHVSAYITLGVTGNLRLAALVGEHMKLHDENFHVEKLQKFFTEEDIEYLRKLKYYDTAFN